MRLWGGRFGEETDARVADFTRSIEVDAALALDDIAGSIAHVRGLGRAGLLTRRGGRRPWSAASWRCADEVEAGSVAWDPALEDVHMNLEAALDRADRAGRRASSTPAGRATTRSRRTCGSGRAGRSDASTRRSLALERALVGLAERDGEAVLPGTTHIQPAQPVLFAHHLLAYVEMLERDRGRLADARRRPTSRRSAPGRSPAPATRSTARRPPRSSASTA